MRASYVPSFNFIGEFINTEIHSTFHEDGKLPVYSPNGTNVQENLARLHSIALLRFYLLIVALSPCTSPISFAFHVPLIFFLRRART